MDKLTMHFTIDEVNTIMQALQAAPMPYVVTAPLLQSIQRQGQMQLPAEAPMSADEMFAESEGRTVAQSATGDEQADDGAREHQD